METLTIATSPTEIEAIEAIRDHHAKLSGALSLHVDALVTAAGGQDAQAFAHRRVELIRWLGRELVPHALAEEETLYPAGGRIEGLEVLVRAMLDEHGRLAALVTALENTEEVVRCAAVATAIGELFDSHARKEEDYLLPALAAEPGVSVADLLEGMHDLVGGHDDAPEGGHLEDAREGGHPGHDCTCGETDEQDPELDVRTIPHAIRHATVFGALSAVQPGGGKVLIAHHDPLPLLAQVEQRHPDTFIVGYEQRGPDVWRLRFARES